MIKEQESISAIKFEAILFNRDEKDKDGSLVLIRLPKSASEKLPSRGMTMVEGAINEFPFQAVLEPDGEGSHWFIVSDSTQKGAKVGVGDTVILTIVPTKKWPEPKVPTDLKDALVADSKANETWQSITPMARWDWIRWIGATKQQETRKRRIEVACSKLKSGMRRPCCFNRSQCTITDIWPEL